MQRDLSTHDIKYIHDNLTHLSELFKEIGYTFEDLSQFYTPEEVDEDEEED